MNLEWVRGHNDNTGNEMADYLAKAGRDSTPHGGGDHDARWVPPRLPYTPPNFVKSQIKEYFWKIWENEWTKSNLH